MALILSYRKVRTSSGIIVHLWSGDTRETISLDRFRKLEALFMQAPLRGLIRLEKKDDIDTAPKEEDTSESG